MYDFDDFNDALMWLAILYPQSTLGTLREDLIKEDDKTIEEYARQYSIFLESLRKVL